MFGVCDESQPCAGKTTTIHRTDLAIVIPTSVAGGSAVKHPWDSDQSIQRSY